MSPTLIASMFPPTLTCSCAVFSRQVLLTVIHRVTNLNVNARELTNALCCVQTVSHVVHD